MNGTVEVMLEADRERTKDLQELALNAGSIERLCPLLIQLSFDRKR